MLIVLMVFQASCINRAEKADIPYKGTTLGETLSALQELNENVKTLNQWYDGYQARIHKKLKSQSLKYYSYLFYIRCQLITNITYKNT